MNEILASETNLQYRKLTEASLIGKTLKKHQQRNWSSVELSWKALIFGLSQGVETTPTNLSNYAELIM